MLDPKIIAATPLTQHINYILSLLKHSQIKVYAIIVINGFCRLKLVKDHPVGDLPAGPPPVFPLK